MTNPGLNVSFQFYQKFFLTQYSKIPTVIPRQKSTDTLSYIKMDY
jgi:hypothetical protein